jgi:membrane-associated progesterone receptor component
MFSLLVEQLAKFVESSSSYIIIAILFAVGWLWMSKGGSQQRIDNTSVNGSKIEDENETSPVDPVRNFTLKQLRKFNGLGDSPLYLSVNGIVFNVSKAKDFYGAGGPYECFAGRECGVALAKMSFEETHLDDLEGCSTILNHGEKCELHSWIEKFRDFRCYPVMGRLVPDSKLPSADRIVSIEELAQHDGTSSEIPEGYAAVPIYLGAGGKVFDVSFGGIEFYGPKGGYHRFAGKNASRALAKMSFDPADTANPVSLEDLTEKEKQTLNDWVKTFEDRKCYPCVGRLE